MRKRALPVLAAGQGGGEVVEGVRHVGHLGRRLGRRPRPPIAGGEPAGRGRDLAQRPGEATGQQHAGRQAGASRPAARASQSRLMTVRAVTLMVGCSSTMPSPSPAGRPSASMGRAAVD